MGIIPVVLSCENIVYKIFAVAKAYYCTDVLPFPSNREKKAGRQIWCGEVTSNNLLFELFHVKFLWSLMSSSYRVGYQADALAKWVAERTNIQVLSLWSSLIEQSLFVLQITIMRPPNYMMLTLWAAVVIVVLVFAYWRRENLSIVYNSQNWAFLAIVSDSTHL